MDPSTFFDRYLYPSLLEQHLSYHPSASSGFVGRASYAASRIFVTSDDSGKRRLNSSYFLGALTSVAIHTAYRPYWTRSTSATFNNFGSTIGSDAGINLFHEFGPAIRQLIRGHPSQTGSGIGERITHDQKPRGVVSTLPDNFGGAAHFTADLIALAPQVGEIVGERHARSNVSSIEQIQPCWLV
jgi:hypothetical protein